MRRVNVFKGGTIKTRAGGDNDGLMAAQKGITPHSCLSSNASRLIPGLLLFLCRNEWRILTNGMKGNVPGSMGGGWGVGE